MKKISSMFINLIQNNKLLSEKVLFVLVKLSDLINDENIIVKENGSPMSGADIVNYLGHSVSTTKRALRVLRNYRIIYSEKQPNDRQSNKSMYRISHEVFKEMPSEEFINYMIKIGNSEGEGVSEKHVEDLIVKKIAMVEEGMRVIDRQHHISEGIIDILAIDANNKKCIIEVKNVEDCKDLIFQSVYYPTQFNDDVRMICVCPNYTSRIYTSLKSLQYVEMKRFILSNDNRLVRIENVI